MSERGGSLCIGFIMGRVTNGLNAFGIPVQIENDELHLNKRQIPAFPEHEVFFSFLLYNNDADDINGIYRSCILREEKSGIYC